MLTKKQEQQQRLPAANNVVVVCDSPKAPDMALNDSFCSHDDPKILEQSLTIPHIIPKSQFQRCFQQRQKCWTCRINLEWDDDDDKGHDDKNNNTTKTTTTNYKDRCIVRYQLNPETSRNTLKPLQIPNTGKHCAEISDVTNNFHIIDVIIICNRTNLCVLNSDHYFRWELE
jgi:hypothetical protein